MENKIIQNDDNSKEIIDEIESKFNSFINKITSKYNLSKNSDLKNPHIIGKILYYIKDVSILFFTYNIPKNSLENIFKKDIIFAFEFIHNKVPYVKVLSNFIYPTLFDGRNLFYHLTNNYDYIFNDEKLDECEIIIDEIIKGIKAFIKTLKENLEIKVLIYYGNYTLNHIYLMNDFLINGTVINFFRIHDLNNEFNNIDNNNEYNKTSSIKNKNIHLKYIILTELFFLVFEPLEENKSYGKLIKIYHLKDINIVIKNNSKDKDKEDSSLNTYYIKINKDINNSLMINFILIHKNNVSEKTLKEEEIECDYDDYIEFKNCLEDKKEKLNYGNYLLVIKNTKNLNAVNQKLDTNKKKFISESRCSDYKKYIEYYEILYDYYKKKNGEDAKNKLKDIFNKLTFFCVELITFKDSNPKENLIYKSKLEKYSKYCLE